MQILKKKNILRTLHHTCNIIIIIVNNKQSMRYIMFYQAQSTLMSTLSGYLVKSAALWIPDSTNVMYKESTCYIHVYNQTQLTQMSTWSAIGYLVNSAARLNPDRHFKF